MPKKAVVKKKPKQKLPEEFAVGANKEPMLNLLKALDDDLLCSFVWSETEEGIEYWSEVKTKLIRIAKKGK